MIKKKQGTLLDPLLPKVCFSVSILYENHVIFTLLDSKMNEIKFLISQDTEPCIACTVTYFIKFENPTSK